MRDSMENYDQAHALRRPYRSRHGWFFGVIQGVADYSGLPAFWLRVTVVVLTFLTAIAPMVALYVIAAVLMKPAPALRLESDEDLEFYYSYTSSRSMALAGLKRRLDQLERRARRMENAITSPEFDWERRLQS